MSWPSDAVHAAIDRWVAGGLLDATTADRLRAEVAGHERSGTRRLSQYVLAGAGAVVLLFAAGVFVRWTWPRIDHGARTTVIFVGGTAAYLIGQRVLHRRRWRPAGYLLHAAGLGLVLAAAVYAEDVWASASGIRAVGSLVGLALGLVATVRSLGRDPVLPALHLVFALLFLALFLDRALGMGETGVLLTLDAVIVVLAVALVVAMRRDPHGDRHPWALGAFVAGVYAAFVLIPMTTATLWSSNTLPIVALDVWLLVVVALAHWGARHAPPGIRREWFGRHVGWAILAWIPLGLLTAAEVLDDSPWTRLLLVAGIGGVGGFLYANRYDAPGVLRWAALAFVVGVWYWSVEQAGAAGAAAALAVTGAVLFWLSGRWGGRDAEGTEAEGDRAGGGREG